MTAVSPSEASQQIVVTLPRSLLERLNEHIPPGQRNAFIVQAIEEGLNISQQLAALVETKSAEVAAEQNRPIRPADVHRWANHLRNV